MSDIENIEIRFCLIGEPQVGKSSIISRFKILNSSQTIKWNNHAEKSQSEIKIPNSPSRHENILKGNEADNNKRKTHKEDRNQNFSKILTVSKFRLEFKFFPISPAVVDVRDNRMKEEEEEDEEMEKDHKLNFEKVKSEIEKIINQPTTIKGAELKIIFLYIFDISNFPESFEKIKIYKEVIEGKNFNSSHHQVLIANKIDSIPKNFDRKEVTHYINESSLRYYEISTKMFFSFEKFFEKLFFDVFTDMYDSFNTEYFRERFNNIMILKETFSKAARKSPKPNDYPSPQDYSSNVYDVKELKNVFKQKENYKKKIFVNKTGPVFDHRKESFNNKKKKSEAKMMQNEFNKENQEKEEKEFFELERKKNKIKEDFFTERQGYSFGIKPGRLNIKNKKRKECKQMFQNVDVMFGIKNITNEPLRRERKRSISAKTLKSYKSASPRIKFKKPSKLPALNYEKNLPNLIDKPHIFKTENEGSKKIPTILKEDSEKNIQYNTNESKPQKKVRKFIEEPKEILEPKPKLKRAKSTRNKIVKKEPFIVPASNTYDVRGKFDPKRGFTFGGKFQSSDNLGNSGPGFLSIPSDIDMMLSKPKFAAQKSYAPRFKDPPRIILGEIKEIEEKLKNMEENRIRLALEKLPKFEQLEKKRYEAMLRKEERDNTLMMKYGWYEQEIRDINYNLVEESTPMYSIKGRYDKGYLNADNNYEMAKLYGLDQSVTQLSKNINKDLTDLPKYNAVKPTLPSYSISVAPRFQEVYKSNLPAPDSYFKDNIGNEILLKPGSKYQAYMGNSNRFIEKSFNVPGPGNYKIPGFTDEVLKKAGKKKQDLHGNKSESDGDPTKNKLKSVNKNSSEMNVMMDLLEYEGSRIDNSEADVSQDAGNKLS